MSGECQESGEMQDELFFDRLKNKSFVVKKERKGTKHAALTYERVAQKDELTLVRVNLLTGRTHQIRVQFSSRKMALFGDGKYGSRYNGDIALHCESVEFTHPKKHTKVHITCPPQKDKTPWNVFLEYIR